MLSSQKIVQFSSERSKRASKNLHILDAKSIFFNSLSVSGIVAFVAFLTNLSYIVIIEQVSFASERSERASKKIHIFHAEITFSTVCQCQAQKCDTDRYILKKYFMQALCITRQNHERAQRATKNLYILRPKLAFWKSNFQEITYWRGGYP